MSKRIQTSTFQRDCLRAGHQIILKSFSLHAEGEILETTGPLRLRVVKHVDLMPITFARAVLVEMVDMKEQK